MNEILTLAAEMKEQARLHPLSRQHIMSGILAAKFPPELRRTLTIDGVEYRVHFSHDELSTEKELVHLSCSQQNAQRPDEKVQEILRKAFFSEKDENALGDVVIFPSMTVGVLHMGYVREK
jgi:hypothetical protein